MTLYGIKIVDWLSFFSYDDLREISPVVIKNTTCAKCKNNKSHTFNLSCCPEKLCGECLDTLYDNDIICPFCKNILDIQ